MKRLRLASQLTVATMLLMWLTSCGWLSSSGTGVSLKATEAHASVPHMEVLSLSPSGSGLEGHVIGVTWPHRGMQAMVRWSNVPDAVSWARWRRQGIEDTPLAAKVVAETQDQTHFWWAELRGSRVIVTNGHATLATRLPPGTVATRFLSVATRPLRAELVVERPRRGFALLSLTTGHTKVQPLPSTADVEGLVRDPDGDTWIACKKPNQLLVVASDGIARRVPLPGSPMALERSRDQYLVLLSDTSRTLATHLAMVPRRRGPTRVISLPHLVAPQGGAGGKAWSRGGATNLGPVSSDQILMALYSESNHWVELVRLNLRTRRASLVPGAEFAAALNPGESLHFPIAEGPVGRLLVGNGDSLMVYVSSPHPGR